jgi:hypothetical protein
MKNSKKTIMFHHEFLALLRFVPPDKAMMVIKALCDIDLGIEPDISDPDVKALVETKRESVLDERKKYEEAVRRINKAREGKTDSKEVNDDNSAEINDEIRNKNTEVSDKNSGENTEINDEIMGEINDEITPSSSSSSSSSFLTKRSNDDDEEFKKASQEKNSSSSPVSESGADPPNQSGMLNQNATAVWEIIRKEWNSHNCRFTCDKIFLNLSQNQRERVRGSMATFTPDQMVKAIRKYFDERRVKPGGYEYNSFYLFIEKGIEFYVDA